MEFVVDADRTVEFSIDFYVVSVDSEDLDRVVVDVQHVDLLLVGEHVVAEDQSACASVCEVQRLIRPKEVTYMRLRVNR